MERLKLDVLTLVPEHVHHHLQVGLVGDIPGHNIEICAVKQDLSEELERLSLGYIVLRQDKGGVRSEEAIIVLFEILGHHWFVTSQGFLECRMSQVDWFREPDGP